MLLLKIERLLMEKVVCQNMILLVIFMATLMI